MYIINNLYNKEVTIKELNNNCEGGLDVWSE